MEQTQQHDEARHRAARADGTEGPRTEGDEEGGGEAGEEGGEELGREEGAPGLRPRAPAHTSPGADEHADDPGAPPGAPAKLADCRDHDELRAWCRANGPAIVALTGQRREDAIQRVIQHAETRVGIGPEAVCQWLGLPSDSAA